MRVAIPLFNSEQRAPHNAPFSWGDVEKIAPLRESGLCLLAREKNSGASNLQAFGPEAGKYWKRSDMKTSGIPIWWDKNYIGNQERTVLFFKSTEGLAIPYSDGGEVAEVGLVGPYSMAYPLEPESRYTFDNYKDAWEQFSNHLRKDIIIRLPPRSHFPELVDQNTKALLSLGAEMLFEDQNFSIRLDGLGNAFRRNRIRDATTASKLGMKFSSCSIEQAMELIAINRQAKGRPVSMDARQAVRLDHQTPERIRTFAVKLNESLVSAAILLRVDDRIDYVFMWGHDPSNPLGGKSLSLLAQGLVAESRADGKRMLCLGVASSEGVRDEGLSSFKEGLGAEAESRPSLRLAKHA